MPSERLYVGPGSEGRGPTGDGLATGAVPDDFALQASKRVAVLALIIVIASLWGMFKGRVLIPVAGGPPRETAYWGLAVALVASVAMGIISWRGLLPPRVGYFALSLTASYFGILLFGLRLLRGFCRLLRRF